MITRRTVLTTTVAATAGVALPAAAHAAPATVDTPGTLSRGRAALTGRLRVTESDFPLSHLGVRWRGPAAQVRLRTRAGWGKWQTLRACCPGGRDGRAPASGGNALLITRGAIGYEVWVAGQGSAHVVELNTVERAAGWTRPPAVYRKLPLPGGVVVPVPYLPRSAWGADESLRTWAPEYYPTQALTVHHTAGANDDPNPAATVRAIYRYQCVDQGWGDIGYNLLIDEAGRVYEGRWSGTDGVPAFSGSLMAGAAHAVGYNAGNIGVCLLGDFTSRQPTAAARQTLTLVLAGLAQVCKLDPRGTVTYVNPVNGNTKTNPTISGHRDWGATECPGNAFYPELPALREAVAAVPRL